jgi:hypothetical protein
MMERVVIVANSQKRKIGRDGKNRDEALER